MRSYNQILNFVWYKYTKMKLFAFILRIIYIQYVLIDSKNNTTFICKPYK